MLPAMWLTTVEMVLTGGPQQVPIPEGAYVELIWGTNAFPWGFAAQSAGPFFPVPAGTLQPVHYDGKGELWLQGAGTTFLSLFGQWGPGYSAVVPPSDDVLLQENGFALLQEDGSFILLEP